MGWGLGFSVSNRWCSCVQIHSEFYGLVEQVLVYILDASLECSAMEICEALWRSEAALPEQSIMAMRNQVEQLQKKECWGQTLWAVDDLLAGPGILKVSQLCGINLGMRPRGDSLKPVSLFQLRMEPAYGFATGQKMFEVTANDLNLRHLAGALPGQFCQITTTGYGSLPIVSLRRLIVGWRKCLQGHEGVSFKFHLKAPPGVNGDAPQPEKRCLTVRIEPGVAYGVVLLGPKVVLAPPKVQRGSGKTIDQQAAIDKDSFRQLPLVYWAGEGEEKRGKKRKRGGGKADGAMPLLTFARARRKLVF